MSFIKNKWTAKDAEEWGREDWIAITLSALSYITLMVGSALSIMLIPSGFVILGIGIVSAILMYKVIDPKLKTISSSYEAKQKDYLHQLDEIQKWEATK